MICHKSYIKITRRNKSNIAIDRDLLHESNVKILFSNFLTAAPQPPENLSVVDTLATEVSLDWDDLASFDSYTVYVKNVASGVTEQTITGLGTSDAVVTDLTEETEYEFWVTAVRDSIEGEESNHVTTTTLSGVETRNIDSLSFDGIDDYVEMSTLSTGESVSISAVVYVAGSTGNIQAIAGQGYLAGDVEGFGLFLKSDLTPAFQTRNEGTNVQAEDATPLDPGRWYVLTGVRDGSTDETKLYITGVLKDTAAGVLSSISNTATPFRVSRRPTAGDFPFNGKIDEIQVWNKALTRAEIIEHSNKILIGDETDLIGYWNCEDRGASLTDLTSNDNHGTINGATYEYEGFDFDYGLLFDGVDDYVEMDTVPVTGAAARTVLADIKTSNGTKNQAIVSFGAAGTGSRFTLRLNSGVIRIEIEGTGENGSINVADGQRHRIGVTYDGSGNFNGCKVYVDGVLDIDATNSLSLNTGNSYFRIGDDPNFSYEFDGIIDKVSVWDSEFTQLEVQRNTNKELEGDEANLVGLWKFDDLSDLSVAVDSTGNDDGTINGAQYSADVLSYFQGLTFDGTNDYVNIGSPAELNITGSLTLEAWIKLDIMDAGRAVITWINGNHTAFPYHLVVLSDGTIRLNRDFNTADSDPGAISMGVFHHLAVTHDVSSGIAKHIVDGVEVKSQSFNPAIGSGDDFLSISRSDLQQWQGGIQRVRVWNIARTVSEINDNKDQALTGAESGLVGLWELSEGVGSKTYDLAGTNHGTINGAAFTPKVAVKL